LIDQRARPGVSDRFPDLVEASELEQGRAARLVLGQAGAALLVGGHLDEGSQLVVQILLDALSEQQVLEKAHKSLILTPESNPC
jgi:hypothetical protein